MMFASTNHFEALALSLVLLCTPDCCTLPVEATYLFVTALGTSELGACLVMVCCNSAAHSVCPPGVNGDLEGDD